MLKPAALDLLNRALLGNEDAVQLNAAVVEVAHTWDDLVDRDRAVPDEEVHRAFRLSMSVIPANAFYRAHFHELHPLIDNMIVNWLAANELERNVKNPDVDLPVAFVIRSDYSAFLLKSMLIVGGFEHARQMWPEVRRFWHREGFNFYLDGLSAEMRAREESTDVHGWT